MNKFCLTEEQERYAKIKRKIDLILSFIGIVLLSPILALICIAVKLDSAGPVIFRQKRIGKNKEVFEIYKFRTMRVDTPDVPTHLLKNPDYCVTRVGKFLRKTSLDELPQLFNIFKGEMSIIGPRPHLWTQKDIVAERDKYGANQITPGLTGWAQINGRDELAIPVKAQLDGEYVQNFGFKMDLKCFWGTIGSILKSEGVVDGAIEDAQKSNLTSDGMLPPEIVERDVVQGRIIGNIAAFFGGGIGLVILKVLLTTIVGITILALIAAVFVIMRLTLCPRGTAPLRSSESAKELG